MLLYPPKTYSNDGFSPDFTRHFEGYEEDKRSLIQRVLTRLTYFKPVYVGKPMRIFPI